MVLYFLRHAEAEESGPSGDASRRLTDRGRERSEEVGRAFKTLGPGLSTIVTSPLVRAVQTAELVAKVLGAEVLREARLGGDVDITALQAIFRENDLPQAVMLVGHEPDFSSVIGELIGGGDVEMKKGAVACLAVRGLVRGGARLQWLLTGKQLSGLAGPG